MKAYLYGFLGVFTFFVLVGLLERWHVLDPVLDFFGIP